MNSKIMTGVKLGAVSGFLLFAMCGCGIYGKFQTPQHEVIEEAYGDALTQDTVSMGDTGWREFFKDERLCALIDTALTNNVDMQTAALLVEQAQASLRSAKLAYVPAFDFSPNASYSSVSRDWSVTLPVNASWEVDIFGNILNAKRGKQAALLKSEAYEQAVRSQLIATVASTYYTLLALDAQYAIYQETERSWRENVEVTRSLMKAGRVNAASLAQTEANYYNVCNGLIDLRQQIHQTENQLCSLLGWPSSKVERGTLADWTGPDVISTGVPLKVLSKRPDVKQAEQALATAFYATNAARSAFYPKITISGGASYDLTSMIYNAVGSLVQPIFQRGTLKANLDIAKSQEVAAALAFRQAIIDAGIEVNDAFVAVNCAREKADNYANQVERLEEAVRSTQLLMTYGSTTYLEVLTAQQTLLDAQIGEVANRLSEISGVITLYQALGGGSEAEVETDAEMAAEE